ncbi:MAG: ABC transporter ATP-binding protein [Bacteroidales bacterium]|nr:ABC transporter ATP-binding protein [Bacteroidales bacterium]
MNTVLRTTDLTKSYGSIVAVKDVSLLIREGNILGLLGPNGSGKTTTLAIITGIVHADSGSFNWFGEEPFPAQRKKIGSLIEVPNFYPYLSLERNLRVIASIKGIPESDITRVLTVTGLKDRSKSNYDTLSLGMKQRLALAAVLLGDPDVLVLDEPTNGLDPEGITEVREIILNEATKQKTIILASHILDEVEKVCTHVGILKKGELISFGKVNELLAADDPVIISCDNITRLEEELIRSGMTNSVEKDNHDLILVLKKEFSASDVNKFAFDKGHTLTKLETRKKSLESQFLELVK